VPKRIVKNLAHDGEVQRRLIRSEESSFGRIEEALKSLRSSLNKIQLAARAER
jgi:hypothetical protein